MDRKIIIRNRDLIKFITYMTDESFEIVEDKTKAVAEFKNTKAIRDAKHQFFDILNEYDSLGIDAATWISNSRQVDMMFVEYVRERRNISIASRQTKCIECNKL